MTVEDDPDVTGETILVETVEQVSLVDAVEETKSHGDLRCYRHHQRSPLSLIHVETGIPLTTLAKYPVTDMDRLTLGRMQNPIRGFLHGTAAFAAIVGLFVLLSRAWGNQGAAIGSLVFGLAMLAMFTVSSLYHSVPWSIRWKTRLQRVDHSMIFLLVAGTFTPIAIATVDGAILVLALAVVWTVALTGILLKVLLPNVKTSLSVTLQLVMGWSALILMPWVFSRLGVGAVVLIALGGVCYTSGAVIFSAKRPRLFPRTFSYHELFHVLVIGGCLFHFLAVLWYAIPATV
jgi:hemolysin III